MRSYSGKNGCNRAKVVVIGQKYFYSCKVVVFRQKWLYSAKRGCIRVKLVLFRKKLLQWKNGMKVLIKHFKESGLALETMLHTQRSRPFPKPGKWLIFGILVKGGPRENFYDTFTNDLAKFFCRQFD